MSTTPSDWLRLKDAPAVARAGCSRLHNGVCMARSIKLTAVAGTVIKGEVGVVPFAPKPLLLEAPAAGDITAAARDWSSWREQQGTLAPGGKGCGVSRGERCPFFEAALLPACPRAVIESYNDAHPDCEAASAILDSPEKAEKFCPVCGETMPARNRSCRTCLRAGRKAPAKPRSGMPQVGPPTDAANAGEMALS